jgi:hypothetical protein
MVRQLLFVVVKIGQKKLTIGGGIAIAKSLPAGQICLAHLVAFLNYTTINFGVAGFGRNWLGDGDAASFF